MSFLSGMSIPAYRSWEKGRARPQASSLPDVLGDLQSFIAWSEEIKLDMSCDNPSLYKLLGSLAFSKQPIEEGSVQASFLGRKSHLATIDADKTLEATELHERNLGRQLGCLLVQRTQGETQQLATRWLSATNGWEAWRQLNLSFLSRLLTSLLQISLDDEQPASCLQPVPAWKERVVGHQELSGEESQLKRDQACQQSRQQNQESKQQLARRGKGKRNPTRKRGSLQASTSATKVRESNCFPTRPRELAEKKLLEGKGKDKKSNPRAGACTDKLHQKEGKGHQTTPSFQKELTNKPLWCHMEKQPASREAPTDSLEEKTKQEERT